MKKQFQVQVKAPTAEDAFKKAQQSMPSLRDRTWRMINDKPDIVRQAVHGKLQRVLENPVLYADKVSAYKAMLDTFDKVVRTGKGVDAAVAQIVLDHGDSRVDNPKLVGIRAVGSTGSWLVFGFEF